MRGIDTIWPVAPNAPKTALGIAAYNHQKAQHDAAMM